MSPRTVFLGKLIGLYCIVVAVSMLTHKESTIAAMKSMFHDPGLLFIGGLIAVMVGLATLLCHNVWSGRAPTVLVTLFGWIALIKGIVILFLPTKAVPGYFAALHFDQLFYFYVALMLVLGAYLTYAGFKSASARSWNL